MYICGQEKLRSSIDKLIKDDKFPRFSIICGNVGFGKKVISDYIARSLGANLRPCDVSVDSVREAISEAYNIVDRTVYMFFDCDDMSSNAKNALLKVTEEPPNDAYFIMTVRDISNVLGTLISRGTVFNLNQYTIKDLDDFIEHKNYKFDKKELSIVHQICVCPKDIMIASEIDIKEVYDLADKFIQYIGQVSLANELKISTQLSTKKDDKKIDPILYMRCIMLCCNEYILGDCTKEDLKIFHEIIKTTSKCLQDLLSKGCNRQLTLDSWIVSTHTKICGGAS